MPSDIKKRIGILRGGFGKHYGSSLHKGGDILSHIFENLSHKYKTFDILIDKKGIWHINGVPIMPAELANKIDLVWDTTYPSFSVTLNNFSIPNIGVSSFSHALENSKEMLREHIAQIGVSMPRSIILPIYQKDFDACPPSLRSGEGGRGSRASPVDGLRPRERYAIRKAKEIHEKFAGYWIVRSLTPETNMGVHLAKTFNELVMAIEDGVKHKTSILVEEFISGKVASVHSVPGFRGQNFYVFPPVNVFGSFSSKEKERLIDLTKNLHNHLGVRHYLKSNFILNKRNKIYLLDFESIPNLKSFSHFSQACESVGAEMHHVIEHILERAL
jgi:hypothetical protein